MDSDKIESAFDSFGFRDEILTGVKEAGFKVPSPIQEQSIPLILQGRDIIGQAHTGTGKTAAFGLPTMNSVKGKGVHILIITPTRELANQVSEEMFKLGKYAGIRTATVYGGQSAGRQIKLIEDGVQVVVATPGRLLDMISNNRFKNFNPKVVILDEADEMLDMGFYDDIIEIFKYLPSQRQTLLFSATMEKNIKELSRSILDNPEFVSVTHHEKSNTNIKQIYYMIDENERDDAIVRLIESENPVKAIIFCRMKREVDRLSSVLNGRGVASKVLHGDMEQRHREETIKAFRGSDVQILVATDVASRGLDISDVSHVFNYHIPFDPDSYVHRIGRTGRAGKEGKAITLVTPIEYKGLMKITKSIKSDIEFKSIPTIDEANIKKSKDVAEQIKSIKIDNSALEVLRELEEEMDLTQIACKLISKLIKSDGVNGPDKIGFNQKSLEKIISTLDHRDRDKRPSRRRSGGFGGGGGGNNRRRDGGNRSKSSQSGGYRGKN